MSLNKVDSYLIYLFVLILPVYPYSLLIFATYFVVTLIFIKIIKIISNKKIEFSTGTFDIPVTLFSLVYLISTLFLTPSKMASIINPATTSIIIIGSLLYFLTNQMNFEDKKRLIYFFIASSIVYSVEVLFMAVKILPSTKPDQGYISSSIFLVSTIPLMIFEFIKQKEFGYKFLFAVSVFITIFTIIVSAITSPKIGAITFKDSATIASGVLKTKLLTGIGSGNYIEAFNKFRPFDFNLTKNWATKYEQGPSFLITNLTETGLIGSIAFLALVATYINLFVNNISKKIKSKNEKWEILNLTSCLLLIVGIIIFQPKLFQIFILFLTLGYISDTKSHEHTLNSYVISSIIALPMLALVFLPSYKIYYLVKAESKYNKGLAKLTENKAKESYDLLKESVQINSKVDRYHRALSSINFGIANALSKQKTNELTDTDKEQITIFVQESINEAKAAVSLNNKSAENWEFLGRTYHLIIPFTKGADQFAIDSYKEAIALDPINPNLRIRLGEIYMTQKDYKNAIESFKLAILAKSDHPNAHFNLATAYKENNDINNAKIEIKKTMELIDKENTKDYEMAKKEFDYLNSNNTPTN